MRSPELNNSFENYRKTSTYEKEVENRMRVLSQFGFDEKFMEALAKYSVDTGIKVHELLENEELIRDENSRLKGNFEILDEKQRRKSRTAVLTATA